MSVLLDDSGFWLSICTLFIGFLSGFLAIMYKSKCTEFTCCYGLFNITRNVQAEIEDNINNQV